jgi:hypothetical protein
MSVGKIDNWRGMVSPLDVRLRLVLVSKGQRALSEILREDGP